jgi:hypothetical protein
MRFEMVWFAVFLFACSEGERDGASTIYGSSAGMTMSAEGSELSAEGSSSANEGDTTTSTNTNGDDESTSDSTTDDTDTTDPTDDTETTEDTADTAAPVCGNGAIDPGEQCDGNNLGGESCVDHGFDGGVLACDPIVCVYDTSGCTDMPSNECDNFCNGCTCPSFECSMCCANKGQVDVCGGGMCGCF